MGYKKSFFNNINIYIAIFRSLLCIAFFCLSRELKAQASFQSGQYWFQKRAVQADSFSVNPESINNAIEALEKSIDEGYRPEETGALLLKSYYFKGLYADLSDDKGGNTFKKACNVGDKMRKDYPESVAISYWYGVNLRKCREEQNFWQNTYHRINKKIRSVAKDVIALDSTYQGGGGFRLLAKTHFETRSFFLIKSWPSNEKALEYIRRAVKIAPKMPENRYFYARMLIHFGRNSEAQTQIQHIYDLKPRTGHLVEDRHLKHQAHMLWKEHLTESDE